MRSTRLTLALETGAVTLPADGRIVVYRPQTGDDLSDFPQDRVLIVQGFRPDHDYFAARGYRVAMTGEAASAALVCLPRAKAEARALIADAAAAVGLGGLIIIDGQKTDGIDAVYKELRARQPVSEALSKAHGKIFTTQATAELAEWTAKPQQIADGFVTLPGVFSADAPDRGSVLLAQALPPTLPGRVVDLGAGWGYLARAILAREGVKELHLVEAEAAALDCARRNISDPRAVFHWADATTWAVPHLAGAVVCNPPFHTSRDADPQIGAAFLRAAAKMLAPNGSLWLVANRHLPYDPILKTLFREVAEIGGDGVFKLTRASYPARR